MEIRSERSGTERLLCQSGFTTAPTPPAKELLGIDAKRCSQSLKYQKRGISFPRFQPAEIGLMNLGAIGEFLLADFLCPAQFLNVKADSVLKAHARKAKESSLSAHRL